MSSWTPCPTPGPSSQHRRSGQNSSRLWVSTAGHATIVYLRDNDNATTRQLDNATTRQCDNQTMRQSDNATIRQHATTRQGDNTMTTTQQSDNAITTTQQQDKTTARKRNRASVARKITKNVKASMSKWSSHAQRIYTKCNN